MKVSLQLHEKLNLPDCLEPNSKNSLNFQVNVIPVILTYCSVASRQIIQSWVRDLAPLEMLPMEFGEVSDHAMKLWHEGTQALEKQ